MISSSFMYGQTPLELAVILTYKNSHRGDLLTVTILQRF